MPGRRISIRRILQTVTTIVALTGVVLAISAAGKLHRADKARNVLVNIRNAGTVGFVDKSAVLQMLFEDRHLNLSTLPVSQVNIHRMEAILRSNPWISSSEVWIDAANDIHLDVTQRVPSVRVYDEKGRGYYLDTALAVIPLSDRYVHYAPVITGVPELHDDSASDAIRGLIRYFFSVVNKDTFWRAQVTQAVLHGGRDFEIVPLVGKQRILIGDTVNLPSKLNRLLRFYGNVLNHIGWDKYDTLDLRFRDQIVARPALAWKKPVDKIAGGDGWMKVIMEAGPKEETDIDGFSLTAPGNTVSPAQPSATERIAAKADSAAKKPASSPAVTPKPKPAEPKKPADPQKPAVPPVKKPVAPPVKKPVQNLPSEHTSVPTH